MNIFKSTQSMSRTVLLGSAAFLLSAGSVLGADRPSDAQAQAGALLAGLQSRPAAAAIAVAHSIGTDQAALDPQAQARRVILGTTNTGSAAKAFAALNSAARSLPGVHRSAVRRTDPDAQALAERMILGGAG